MKSDLHLWHEQHDIHVEETGNDQVIEVLGRKYVAVDAVTEPDNRFIVSIVPMHEQSAIPAGTPCLQLSFYGYMLPDFPKPHPRVLYISLETLFAAGYKLIL
jgi:hypothetical protein